ncbi:hypothetical protein [Citrobacter braakii]|uniref:hypothetical protein n=1 Tax=Citrobacter braakii TaxID=57706 RepID=UPI002B3ACB56|nr:hypothetical protein [Citrobacter braakii]MEB0946942.1 hypothetical protein [Citrobacter braakii]MEB0972179.1 hypothetical protein [Citrobacter braakii]MEB0996554.1 hypothetical protein [Citrobacter braakii]MEB1012188.1 hypothetical protein [Citrobacter braakii]
MNTKRVTAMRHRRLGLRKPDKEKEQYFVIEAAAHAAAMATADAIRNYEEEDDKNSYRLYLYGSRHGVTGRETCLKKQGEVFHSNLAEYIRHEMERNLALYPFGCKSQESGFAGFKDKINEKWQLIYKPFVDDEKNHQLVMHEVPKMSVEKSHAISRRMFARTVEDMAQELYDDAE